MKVALLAEGVGRNADLPNLAPVPQVALLTEGVGRNHGRTGYRALRSVALLTEGVGRNKACLAAAKSRTKRRPPHGGRG